MADNFYLVDPSGKPVVIPTEGNNLRELVGLGYRGRQASPEEISAVEVAKHPVVSAAEGFLHEASFGFADPWVKSMNSGVVSPDEVVRQMRAAKETNAYTAGQVGGFAASMLVPVGGELKLGATLGKAGLKAAGRGAAEGVGMGLGQLVSESTLDIPITAEHAVSTLVGMGLTGGALGTGLHKVAGLMAGGARKVATAEVDKMGDALGRAAVREQFGGKLSDEAIDMMRVEGMTAHNFGATPQQVAVHAAAVREKAKQAAGEVIPLLDNIAPPSDDATRELLRRMASEARKVEDPTLIGKVQQMAKQADDAARLPQVEDTLSGHEAVYSVSEATARAAYENKVSEAAAGHAATAYSIKKQNDAIETAALEAHDKLVAKITAGNTAAEAKAKAAYEKAVAKAKAEHEKMVSNARRDAMAAGFDTGPNNFKVPEFKPPDPIAAVKKELPEFVAPKVKDIPAEPRFEPFQPPARGAKHAALAEEAAALSGAASPKWSDLAGLEREITAAGGKSHFPDIAIAAEKRAPLGEAKAALSEGLKRYQVADELFEAAASSADRLRASKSGDVGLGMVGAVMGHPIAALGEVIMKRAISARWGSMVDNLVSGAVRPSLLKRAANGIRRGLEGMSATAASSPFRVALEHASARGDAALLAEHAAIVNSADGMEYMQQMGLVPEAPGEGGERAGVVNAIASFSDAQGKMNDAHIDGFFAPGKGTRAKTGSFEDFQAKMQNVNSILANPQSLYESLPPQLMGGAPMVAGTATAGALKALQMLSDAAPKDPGAGLPPALKRPWEPSKADLARWYRTLDAIQNPAKAVAEAGTGVVSREAVKVLQNIYPAMYADLQQKVLQRMNKGKLTPAQRTGLQTLFGGPAMSPQQLQVIQQTHQKQAAAQPEGPKPDGRQKVSAQENMETQGQRLEKR